MPDEAQVFFSEDLFSGSRQEGAFSSPSLVVVENRALIGECLALCLRNKLRLPVLTYPDLTSWSLDPAGSCASAIVLSGTEHRRGDQYDILRELCRRRTEVPVVLFSDYENKEQVARSLRCGVKGYIPSDTPLEIASRAIKLVMAGGIFIPANFVMEGDDDARADGLKTPRLDFTPREYDVVKRLQKGESNKLIAHELNLSESSVKAHIRNIMRRLGVHNRTEAVVALTALAQDQLNPSVNQAALVAAR